MEGKVALEEHFSTALNNRHWDAAGEEERNGKAYAQDVERRLLDPGACVAEMERAGIELCIMSLTSPGVQSVADTGQAVELARESNEHAAAFMADHPDRFRAFAAVPLQDARAACDELGRTAGAGDGGDRRFVGALVNGYTNRGADEDVFYLDEAPLDDFWTECVRLKMPVYLRPREPLPSQQRSIRGYPELGGSAWAFFYETSTHAVRLMLSGVFDRFPELQVILGHLGEGLPYMLPRMQHRLDEQREGAKGSKARQRPSYYLANNFHVTTSGHFHTKPFLDAVEQIGRDRIMFSVDYPYEQMDMGGRWFDDVRLADALKLQIGRENANRLFGQGLSALPGSAAAGFGS